MLQHPSERTLIFLVGAVQFVNILDFMMVMPLGPDFATALGIPLSQLGVIGGSYTAAAGVSGLAGSFFLDRFDRRKALAVAMAGLVMATAMGALAIGLKSLIAARVLAGLFGGPASSVALSIVADVVPIERRGKAMGSVMSAFSVASVAGVPAGLILSEHGGWRTPFLAVAGLGAVVAVGAIFMLPSMTGHLTSGGRRKFSFDLFTRPVVLLSYALTAMIFMGNFALIPNIAPYVQKNLHYPRAQFEYLYLAGGAVSFLALRSGGVLVDKFGPLRTGVLGSMALAAVLYAGFIDYQPWLHVIGIFMAFMLAMGFRNVSYNTLTSRVPAPSERAQFMSIQSAVQHFSSALGAIISSQLLHEGPGGTVQGIPDVATFSLVLATLSPVVMALVQERVREREMRAAVEMPVHG